MSEARELSPQSLQSQDGIIAIRSLKKRNQHHIREIPIPLELIQALSPLTDNNTYLWQTEHHQPIKRITAYRGVKQVMYQANITGPQASPKGLRHGFGIHAVLSGVQLHMLQKWMGHASIRTTAIYANAVGAEERQIAQRMW